MRADDRVDIANGQGLDSLTFLAALTRRDPRRACRKEKQGGWCKSREVKEGKGKDPDEGRFCFFGGEEKRRWPGPGR